MEFFLSVLPLLVIIFMLYKKQNMLFSGLIGGILTIFISGISISDANKYFITGINSMLGITVPILYAAIAAMVSNAGSIKALVELFNRLLKGKLAILAGIIVLIQGLATYMAGTGAGNTMVTAPLAATALGVIPEIVAALAIISAIGFTTSPASTETVVTAQNANLDVFDHSLNMMPYTVLFYGIAVILAMYGVYKKKRLLNTTDYVSQMELNNIELLKRSIPALVLLILVVSGNSINNLLKVTIVTPFTSIIVTCVLTYLLTPMNLNEISDELVEGSKFILTTLFSVGIFLSFINMMVEIKTFENLASIAKIVPQIIVLPTAIIIAFLIAIPSGAFTAGVLALILPTLSLLGLSSTSMGFVAIATGLGTQISPVQINCTALSKGFETDLMTVIKYNFKYIIMMLIIVIVISIFTY